MKKLWVVIMILGILILSTVAIAVFTQPVSAATKEKSCEEVCFEVCCDNGGGYHCYTQCTSTCKDLTVVVNAA